MAGKMDEIRRNRKCVIACGACALTVFILFCSCFKTLGPYRLGLRKNTFSNQVLLEGGAAAVYEPGVYFVGFWNSFLVFPSTIQTISYAFETPEKGVQKVTPLHLRSNDRVPMHLEVSVQYRRRKADLVDLFKTAMTDVLQENIFISNVRAELTKVMSKHNSADCWEKREELIAEFLAACKEVLNAVYADCWGLQFYRSHMDEKYEEALIDTQVQKQQKLIEQAKKEAAQVRAETNIFLAGWQKNITVLESEATAKRYNLTTAAVTRAQTNKVDAEANALEYVQEALKLDNGTGMGGDELTEYQEALMLNDMRDTLMYYGLSTAPSYVAMPSAGGSTSVGRRLESTAFKELAQASLAEAALEKPAVAGPPGMKTLRTSEL